MVARARQFHALGDKRTQIDLGAVLFATLVSHLAGLQNLLDGAQQAVGVVQHELVKLLPLRLIYFAALQRFEVEANRGDGSLQFMRDRVDEAAVLLIQANFAHEESSVQDHPENNRGKYNYAEEQHDALAPVQDDPAHVKRNRQGHQRYAQHKEKCNRLSAACDTHGSVGVLNWIVPRRRVSTYDICL